MLADSFLKRVAGERNLRLSAAAITGLKQRRYSGNIRELRNLIERATILVDGEEISERHFEMEAMSPSEQTASSPVSVFFIDSPVSLDELERRYIAWAAQRFEGDRAALADCLAVSSRTLYRKLALTTADDKSNAA